MDKVSVWQVMKLNSAESWAELSEIFDSEQLRRLELELRAIAPIAPAKLAGIKFFKPWITLAAVPLDIIMYILSVSALSPVLLLGATILSGLILVGSGLNCLHSYYKYSAALKGDFSLRLKQLKFHCNQKYLIQEDAVYKYHEVESISKREVVAKASWKIIVLSGALLFTYVSYLYCLYPGLINLAIFSAVTGLPGLAITFGILLAISIPIAYRSYQEIKFHKKLQCLDKNLQLSQKIILNKWLDNKNFKKDLRDHNSKIRVSTKISVSKIRSYYETINSRRRCQNSLISATRISRKSLCERNCR